MATQSQLLDRINRLTRRDRQLLLLLHDHEVLTTNQIAAALFPNIREAQRRLRDLRAVEAVQRVSFAREPGDRGGLRYALGPLGTLLHPIGDSRRGHIARRAQLAQRPDLDHLVGVNGFFTDLLGHARRHPDTRLARWWSEPHATAVYALNGIHPDGHGIWHADGRDVGFFLEHDRGTENHARLLAKLPAYQRLAIAGPQYPVLFHLPSQGREAHFQALVAGLGLQITVATAVHGHNPAGAIWWLAGHQGPRLRFRLDELPSDHGRAGPSNPLRYPDTLMSQRSTAP